jgi:hypothetical protein
MVLRSELLTGEGATTMQTKTIATKSPKTGRSATVTFNYGDTAAETIEMYGDAVVNSNFIASDVINVQGIVRRMLDKGKTEAEIQAKISTRKPGIALSREVDHEAAFLVSFAQLSPEDQAKKIEEMQAKAAELMAQLKK